MKHERQDEDDFSLKSFFVPLTTMKAIHYIVIIGLIVFFTSIFNGFIGDDFQHVKYNTSIHSVANIPYFFSHGIFYDPTSNHQRNNFYRPIVSVAYSLIYPFSGDNPIGYHLFQVLLHISNAILLFLVLKYFFKQAVAFFLSLLFLLHPINIEAVVYI